MGYERGESLTLAMRGVLWLSRGGDGVRLLGRDRGVAVRVRPQRARLSGPCRRARPGRGGARRELGPGRARSAGFISPVAPPVRSTPGSPSRRETSRWRSPTPATTFAFPSTTATRSSPPPSPRSSARMGSGTSRPGPSATTKRRRRALGQVGTDRASRLAAHLRRAEKTTPADMA